MNNVRLCISEYCCAKGLLRTKFAGLGSAIIHYNFFRMAFVPMAACAGRNRIARGKENLLAGCIHTKTHLNVIADAEEDRDEGWKHSASGAKWPSTAASI
ncbi:MAG: hypothetical protein QM636_25060 [Rhizobium sp.]